MKKLNNKKGFTLMEMLIVVAIIAILVAIAIPTFSSSLKSAKQAADNANVRSAYAEAMNLFLTETDASTKGVTSSGVKVQAEYDGTTKIGDIMPTSWKANETVYVHVSTEGVVTITTES